MGKKQRKKNAAYIGIDIGGTKSLYALFDEGFEVLAEEKLRTVPSRGAHLEGFRRGQAKVIKALLAVAKKKGVAVRSVGVGCAGEIDMARGVARVSPNLAFLEGFPMGRALGELVRAPVFVANDVVAGLYGEFTHGCAIHDRHVMGIWIGTGVGGALIVDGRLHVGASGRAGDIGNYLLHPVDVAHEAPRKERLDHVASRYAIAGVAASLAAKHKAPKLRKLVGTDVIDIKAGDLAKAIRLGDKALEKLVRSRAQVLGAALSNLVDFINPDRIVLGGGLVEAMPQLIQREVRRSVQAHSAPRTAKAVAVSAAKLGKHAITVGAAQLALDMEGEEPPLDRKRL